MPSTTPTPEVGMRNTVSELPDYWQREIKALRAENAKYRRERNEARDELEALRARTDV